MIDAQVDSLLTRSNALQQKRRKSLIHLYANGLRSRVDQIDLCLHRLRILCPAAGVRTTDEQSSDPDIESEFYCDAFWTWVYSSLDIFAQIINQAEALGLEEERVSFNTVRNTLRRLNAQPPVSTVVERIDRSHLRAWMVSYRNCANHRRPICLWHETRIEQMTRGYRQSTAPVQHVVRFIADHSVALKPDPKKRTELLPRCEAALTRLEQELRAGLDSLLF